MAEKLQLYLIYTVTQLKYYKRIEIRKWNERWDVENQKTKSNWNLAFVTFVRPLVEYASPVWSPRLARDTALVERVKI